VTCNANFMVSDTIKPVISCPPGLILCSNDTIILGEPNATDNCGTPIITNNAPSIFPAGTTMVTWTATDPSGNSASCVQSVTINAGPNAYAGADAIICQGTANYQVTDAVATNYSSLLWTTSGLGTLQNPATINPIYIPQIGETGNILLTLTVNGIAPCGVVADQKLLTIIPAPIVSAGLDDTICSGQDFTISASFAGYYNSLQWSSSGTGTFSNPSILYPTYFPSVSDIEQGSVILTLTASGSEPCASQSDQMVLVIIKSSTANAGPDGNTCMGIPYTILQASAQNYTSLQWNHNGSGNLSGSNTLIPTYTPAINETGVVTITLSVTGSTDCGNSSDTMELTIFPNPSVNAGPDTAICGALPFIPALAAATGADSILWTSSGTGTFDNPNLLHPTYTPGDSDLLNGSVSLSITAFGYGNCGIQSDNLILYLIQPVSAYAGADTTACSNSPITLNGAAASNFLSLLWTHNGMGLLSNEATLTPTYTPAENESGLITFILDASGAPACGHAIDTLMMQIMPAPYVNAGPGINRCDAGPVEITHATALNYSLLFWTTTGTGSFSDPSALNPVYFPSTEDISAGSVILTITASAASPCGPDSSQVNITFGKVPTIEAGPDASSCSALPYTLSGASASGYSRLEWKHNGTGTLNDSSLLNPTYIPGLSEIGTITFTLTAHGILPCSELTASDQFTLTISQPVLVDAGPDQVLPTGYVANLNGTVTAGSGSYAVQWKPVDLLNDPSSLNTSSLPLNSSTLFSLHVIDLITGCEGTDSMKVVIGSENLPPVANPDYDTASVSQPAIIQILENDYDPDGTITSVTITTDPQHGIAILNADNTITYTPFSGFDGTDTLIYKICDNGMPVLCDTALVVIRVFGERPFDDITIYNFLTPNEDTHNDVWTIDNIQYWPENEVLIFNRWGDRIREFKHYNNTTTVWDGTNEAGRPVPDGTYFYIVKVRHEDGNTGLMKEDALSGFIMVKSNRK
ncbi:MAG: gliding motility-associated C-terminal domain-containing protein, partial [Bacteroidetes bacterium]|nr:gliding motility-associated C-terminal domain-containing protein [Bacteroidota bacterium]